jgi:hypothetical protein
MFQTLQQQNIKIIKVKTPNKHFTSASGGKMSSVGMYKVPMEIEGKLCTPTFQVLPKLHESFILGIDFISEQGLQLCLRHNRFYWTEECPLEHGKVLLIKEEVTLPPHSSKICKVQISGKHEPNDFIAEISLPSQPWIQGAPSIVRQKEGNPTLIEIFNASLVPRTLTKNMNVGNAEILDPARIMSVDEVNKTNCRTSTSTPTSNTKVTDFIAKNAKIEGEKEEKDKYLKLFLKYPQVFSQHKNDLGKCDLIQHEIHLKTKEPVYIKQFKIPEGHQQAVTNQVKEWLKLGIVQTSHSRYNSPIFVVKKKDGSFRLVQDFRALNQQTVRLIIP